MPSSRLKETRHHVEYSVSAGLLNRWLFGCGIEDPAWDGRVYETSVLALAAARRKQRALQKAGYEARLFQRTFAELVDAK